VTQPAILLTGASSFVGAHLAAWFARAGYAVGALHSRPLDSYAPLQRARLDYAHAAGARLRQTDLLDPAGLEQLIADEQPRYFVHHAGWATRYAALDYDLDKGHAINVAPLTALYTALTKHGCKGIVMTGSSAEYSTSDAACTEDATCQPDMPYGLSKLAQSLRGRQLAMLTGLPTRVARLFIPFGAMDAPAKLLPQLRSALQQGQPTDLSPCTQTRDFIPIDDLCRGYEAILKALPDRPDGSFEIFNLCNGPATVRDMLLAMATHLKADAALLRFGAIDMRPGETLFSYGANAKAIRMLDWRPSDLDQAIRAFALAQD